MAWYRCGLSGSSGNQLSKVNPFTSSTVTTSNAVRTTVLSSSVTNGVGALSLQVDGNDSREGINITLANLTVGKSYLLRVDMQMTSGAYLNSGYSQGISVYATGVSNYPLTGGAQVPFIEDLAKHTNYIAFRATATTEYLIVYLVDVTNATHYFTMDNITLYEITIS